MRGIKPVMAAAVVAIGLDAAAAEPDQTASQTSLRTVASFIENPNNTDLYGAASETSNKALLRHSLITRPAAALKVEANAYVLLLGTSDKSSGAQLLLAGTDERHRSSHLERRWHTSHRLDGFLTLDRLNVRADLGEVDAAIGRLPINLATTVVFTPNDFFAPFRAHNSYREFKPGVDAAQVDYALGSTGELSMIAVAGYRSEALVGRVGAAASNRYASQESAALGRLAYTLAGFEGALLGGKLGRYDMAGFTLQGDLGAVGLRAEGHQKAHRQADLASTELAAGLEARVASRLVVFAEQFLHGSGYARASDYDRIETDPEPPLYYVGRDYSALGMTLEATPLVSVKGLSVLNLTDASALLAGTLTYSLSEAGEIGISCLLPRGRGPRGKTVRSEYGAYPRVLTVETGVYF